MAGIMSDTHIPIFRPELGIEFLLGLILKLGVCGVLEALLFNDTGSYDGIIWALRQKMH